MEIDHIATILEIVCPHCGYAYDDTDFRDDGKMEGDEVCEACEGAFSYVSDITVYWTTEKSKGAEG